MPPVTSATRSIIWLASSCASIPRRHRLHMDLAAPRPSCQRRKPCGLLVSRGGRKHQIDPHPQPPRCPRHGRPASSGLAQFAHPSPPIPQGYCTMPLPITAAAFGPHPDKDLTAPIRANGTFMVYAALGLILIGLAEANGASSAWLLPVGLAFAAGRWLPTPLPCSPTPTRRSCAASACSQPSPQCSPPSSIWQPG